MDDLDELIGTVEEPQAATKPPRTKKKPEDPTWIVLLEEDKILEDRLDRCSTDFFKRWLGRFNPSLLETSIDFDDLDHRELAFQSTVSLHKIMQKTFRVK